MPRPAYTSARSGRSGRGAASSALAMREPVERVRHRRVQRDAARIPFLVSVFEGCPVNSGRRFRRPIAGLPIPHDAWPARPSRRFLKATSPLGREAWGLTQHSARTGSRLPTLLGLPLAHGHAPSIAWWQRIRSSPQDVRVRIALSFQGLQCTEGACPPDPCEAKAWVGHDTACSLRMRQMVETPGIEPGSERAPADPLRA